MLRVRPVELLLVAVGCFVVGLGSTQLLRALFEGAPVSRIVLDAGLVVVAIVIVLPAWWMIRSRSKDVEREGSLGN